MQTNKFTWLAEAAAAEHQKRYAHQYLMSDVMTCNIFNRRVPMLVLLSQLPKTPPFEAALCAKLLVSGIQKHIHTFRLTHGLTFI